MGLGRSTQPLPLPHRIETDETGMARVVMCGNGEGDGSCLCGDGWGWGQGLAGTVGGGFQFHWDGWGWG